MRKRVEHSTLVMRSRPMDWQMETQLVEKAVEKFNLEVEKFEPNFVSVDEVVQSS